MPSAMADCSDVSPLAEFLQRRLPRCQACPGALRSKACCCAIRKRPRKRRTAHGVVVWRLGGASVVLGLAFAELLDQPSVEPGKLTANPVEIPGVLCLAAGGFRAARFACAACWHDATA